MKGDGNGVPARHGVPNEHREGVGIADESQGSAERRPWRPLPPGATCGIDVQRDLDQKDRDLERQEHRIRQEPRIPRVHRGQPRHAGERDERLSEHPREEEDGQGPEADARARLVESVVAGSLSADELLRRYCTLVYAQTGSYQETGRRLGLDRRTVREKIDTALLADLRGA
jgi:hypothetical protein